MKPSLFFTLKKKEKVNIRLSLTMKKREMAVGGQIIPVLLHDPFSFLTCIGQHRKEEMSFPPLIVHKSHLTGQQSVQFACAGGRRAKRFFRLQKDYHPAQGASRLAYSPGQGFLCTMCTEGPGSERFNEKQKGQKRDLSGKPVLRECLPLLPGWK